MEDSVASAPAGSQLHGTHAGTVLVGWSVQDRGRWVLGPPTRGEASAAEPMMEDGGCSWEVGAQGCRSEEVERGSESCSDAASCSGHKGSSGPRQHQHQHRLGMLFRKVGFPARQSNCRSLEGAARCLIVPSAEQAGKGIGHSHSLVLDRLHLFQSLGSLHSVNFSLLSTLLPVTNGSSQLGIKCILSCQSLLTVIAVSLPSLGRVLSAELTAVRERLSFGMCYVVMGSELPGSGVRGSPEPSSAWARLGHNGQGSGGHHKTSAIHVYEYCALLFSSLNTTESFCYFFPGVPYLSVSVEAFRPETALLPTR